MIPLDAPAGPCDSILAIHVGDLYVRAAFLGPANRPTNVEDASEVQKYVTPSLVTLDKGGALLGYPAMQAAGVNAPSPLAWRYSRSDLVSGKMSLCDTQGRGLTAMGFTALAARYLVRDSVAWTASRPDVVLVVPESLTPLARLNLATMAAQTAGLPVALVSETQALLSALQLPPADRVSLVASFDDDALRLRLFKSMGEAVDVVAEQTFPEHGLQSLRAGWCDRWNTEAAPLLAGSAAFDSHQSVEFEKIWQDIWQCLDTDPRFKPQMPTWSVVRNSTVLPLVFSRAAAEAEVRASVHGVGARMEALLAAAGVSASTLSNVILVAPAAISRMLTPMLCAQWGIAGEQMCAVSNSAYAQGAALGFARTRDRGFVALTQAPYELGALGVAKVDTGLTLKTLIAAGAPLPAAATFSVMANRDVQRHLVIKLASQIPGAQAELRHQAEFGPLHGPGMLKVKINVAWATDGRITVTAVDTETEQLLSPLYACDMASTGPVIGAADILLWD